MSDKDQAATVAQRKEIETKIEAMPPPPPVVFVDDKGRIALRHHDGTVTLAEAASEE